MNEIEHRLRQLAIAYPEDVFPPITDAEREQYPGLVTRCSAAMGRHFAKIFLAAADEIARLSVEQTEERPK